MQHFTDGLGVPVLSAPAVDVTLSDVELPTSLELEVEDLDNHIRVGRSRIEKASTYEVSGATAIAIASTGVDAMTPGHVQKSTGGPRHAGL